MIDRMRLASAQNYPRARLAAAMVGLLVAVGGLSACRQDSPHPGQDAASGKTLGAIPSGDPDQRRRLVGTNRLADGSLDVVTRVDSNWGTITERHQVDCVRMMAHRRNPGQMASRENRPAAPETAGTAVEERAAAAIVSYVCRV